MIQEQIIFLQKKGFPLREAKYAATKNEILCQFLLILTSQEDTEILIENLYSPLGISRATFFHYFPRKEDIFLYQIQLWMEEIYAAMLPLPEDLLPDEGLYRMYALLADRLCGNSKYPGIFAGLARRYYLRSHSLKPLTEAERALHGLPLLALNSEILNFAPLLEILYERAVKLNHPISRCSLNRLFETLHIILIGGISYGDISSEQSLHNVFKEQLDIFLFYCNNMEGKSCESSKK